MGCLLSYNNPVSKPLNEKTSKLTAVENLQIDSSSFVGRRKGNIKEKYTIGTELGSGTFGFVRIATQKSSGQKRAIKSIKKDSVTKDMKEHSKFFNEIDILIKTDHPNIVRLFEFYEDEKHYHLVTELASGGELFDFIIKNKTLSEPISAHFFKQLLSAVAYCHANKIVHRDLKPENLLLDKDGPDSLLKIIDFGTSKIFDERKMTQKCGSAFYVAPEVIKREYNEKCDVWSCGVILYVLLSGKPPFYGKNDREIVNCILAGTYSMDGPEWTRVSTAAKKLIAKMLQINPADRISAKQALEDEWVYLNTQTSFSTAETQAIILSNLRDFRTEIKLQHAVLAFITSQFISKEDSNILAESFKAIDKNGDGKISKEELLEAYISALGPEAALEEVEKIMQQVDSNNSGFIDYSEFLLASSKKESLLARSNLDSAFKAFDADGDGKITTKELKAILGEGKYFEEPIWKDLIKEVDLNGDGEIDLAEFKEMMLKKSS